MCEDRILQSKKDVGVKAGRVQNVRQRMRAPRRTRQEPTGSDSEGEYMAPQPPSPTPAAHVSNVAHIASNPNMDHSPREADDSWRKYRTFQQNRRDHLIEIAMRTVMLMRQNQQLQQKLAALQADTKIYMQGQLPPRPAPAENPPMEVKVEPEEAPHLQD